MADLQTKPTSASVTEFIERVEHPIRRRDALTVLALFERITGEAPQMWGPAIIGFGSQHYKYESGREGDMPRIGFSPRKANLALYVIGTNLNRDLLPKLGKHKTGVSCLYVNKLDDIDLSVLEEMAKRAWARSAGR